MRFWIAVAMLIGTIIGAGIYGMPFAIAKCGFLLGIIHILGIGALVALMTLYMGEVVMRTKKVKQFVGLAEIYLGKKGKAAMLASMVIGIYGALIAYLVGIGELCSSLVGGRPLFFFVPLSFIYAILVYKGVRAVGRASLMLSFLLISSLLLICSSLLPSVRKENLMQAELPAIFAPYGVVLFAWLGYSVMPEVEIVLMEEKEKISRAVVTAIAICALIYLLFTACMIGNFGREIEEIAINSLSGWLLIVGTIAAVLSMSTSYLTLSLVLRNAFFLDLKLSKPISTLLSCALPLLLLLSLSPTFTHALAVSGAYSGSITGVLSCLMVKRAREMGDDVPAYIVPGKGWLPTILAFLFIFGMISQTISFFMP